MSELKYWIWLSNCSGVSANSKTELLEHFGSPEAAFAHSGSYFGIGGITRRESAELEKRETDGLERIERVCRADGIRIITLEDEAYPERLRQIYSPPAVLYVTGKLPEIDDRPVISVIGTRRPTEYGIKMGYSLAYEITKCGGTVVSLLTAGVDASAANGAIEAGGPVIAVLGTSHDKAGGKLVSRASAAGAVISEYPPFTVPQKVFFRARNRIAAGISVGVAVAEAPEKSGTRLFVREAAEQGKDVFALPGNADSETSAGTLAMLRDGAQMITSGADVMREYLRDYPDIIRIPDTIAVPQAIPKTRTEARKRNGTARPRDIHRDERKVSVKPSSHPPQTSELTEEQKRIIAAIRSGADTVDGIISETCLQAGTVLSQLTILEIRGIISRAPGSRFGLKI